MFERRIIIKYGNLVAGCKNTVIPNSIEFIRNGAFEGCLGLVSIDIPDSVTTIGDYAFSCCNDLTQIKMSDNIKRIGDFAFEQCNITEIIIPDGVTRIGKDAFNRCYNLKSVEIPDSVKDIGAYAFGYYSDGEAYKISDFIIYGHKDSAAQKYADEYGITFRLVSEKNNAADISQASIILSTNTFTYDGTAKLPSITVYLEGKELVLGTDYTVLYSNNTNVGTASVTVIGQGGYTGSKVLNFAIIAAGQPNPGGNQNAGTTNQQGVQNNLQSVKTAVTPKKATLSSVKSNQKKAVTVKWKKDPKASGYIIQFSTDKKDLRNITVQKSKTV